MTRKNTHRAHRAPTYSFVRELLANPTAPTPEVRRTAQLTAMWAALDSIETGHKPNMLDWRMCSDAVNMLETLTLHNSGHWLDCHGNTVQIADQSGLLLDAIKALVLAGDRYNAHGAVRLDGAGIQAVRAVLEDYAAVMEVLPERAFVKAHRLTEKRVNDLLAGRNKQPHDYVLVTR